MSPSVQPALNATERTDATCPICEIELWCHTRDEKAECLKIGLARAAVSA